jgi:hypothetical protein
MPQAIAILAGNHGTLTAKKLCDLIGTAMVIKAICKRAHAYDGNQAHQNVQRDTRLVARHLFLGTSG